MQPYSECPQVLRDFLSYHESIKGQSKRTVSEYHLDLRMFLRFLTLMRKELPYQTPLDEIDIKWIDASVLDTIGRTVKARLMLESPLFPVRGSFLLSRHCINT